jgi:tetratricopeptide (TPR) repeat protein
MAMFGWLGKVIRGNPPSTPAGAGGPAAAAGMDASRLLSLGRTLWSEERIEEAAAALRRAVSLDPALAQAHELLGCALAQLGDRVGAIAAFDNALRIDPEFVSAHCNRGIELLSLGDYARGWQEFEWRWKRPEYQTIRKMFSQTWWDGSDLHGRTILLFAEQGLGDAMQFIRFAPLVARAGARVVVDCHPPLRALFRQAPGVAQVLESDAEIARYDLCSPLMSLPRLLGTTLDTVPAEIPYLAPSADCARRWQEKMVSTAKKIRVGLVWECNPEAGYAWRRSLPLDLFAPLAKIAGVTVFSLQVGFPSGKAAELVPGLDLVDLTEGLHDFSDTAGLVSNLDLVISVDTSVAHLAGALGKPIWVLLPQDSDWRWGVEGEGSPWYPTMRLFRQRIEGDWSEVIERLEAALREFAAPRGH